MADLLNGSPSGTEASTSTGQGAQLDQGEQYCTDQEEALLHRVMALVYHSLNDQKKLAAIESWMHRAPNIGVTIGNIAFMLLMTIFDGAKHAGQQLPPEIFLAQGGAIYQTIDRLIMIAEKIGLHVDPDKSREDALGSCLDGVRRHWSEIKSPGSSGQRMHMMGGGKPNVPLGHPLQQHVMAANPMSAAVSQGLQQQGLMSNG